MNKKYFKNWENFIPKEFEFSSYYKNLKKIVEELEERERGGRINFLETLLDDNRGDTVHIPHLSFSTNGEVTESRMTKIELTEDVLNAVDQLLEFNREHGLDMNGCSICTGRNWLDRMESNNSHYKNE